MNNHHYPSILLENAVNQFAKLPGIGRKTALRLVLHLLKQEKSEVGGFAQALVSLKNEIRYCAVCKNISDTEVCSICNDTARIRDIVCVVETIKDVMHIENTGQYRGLYHVLGGVISPMDGVGPADIEIESLIQRVQIGEIKEIILALNPTMEGDTTCFYLYKKLLHYPITISTIARGISIGDELQYADEVTLGRSIVHRVPFASSLQL
ncbi:MAG: recombination protein RecR [Paludibacteraceae bacterium]|jgi:recombination protein RecR|nr:recombination protein RecR [Paludibacteraceae bacterium]NLK92636.1 recombination protein RecR [Bacteroidales bacterium]MBP6436704.1 recombination protein RecR [Paludibacteraceae bacterium]MBP7219649.1 recombination protein RecR [Paludibacteraceae bacterium]MBP8627138.1 recombination protein RecR [Paludibacteraceae bacterium]